MTNKPGLSMGFLRIGVLPLVSLLIICIQLSPHESSAGEPKAIALVMKATGNVKLKRANPGEWFVPKKGEILDGGDLLRTGEDGFAAVLFQDDKSLVKISSNTELVVNGERQGKAVSKRLWVGAGDLWAKVTKTEGTRFEVETPTSVASVKGSEFYEEVAENGFSSLICIEGEMEFSNDYGSVTVKPGMIATSTGNEAPGLRPVVQGETPGFGAEEGAVTEEEIRIEYKDSQGNIKELIIKRKVNR
ncbi:MAG: FecR family protein [Candidatus Eisenbacteria bacterium]|nr:FecR family protein [Candidatus Eisenbacteria bacterium]